MYVCATGISITCRRVPQQTISLNWVKFDGESDFYHKTMQIGRKFLMAHNVVRCLHLN